MSAPAAVGVDADPAAAGHRERAPMPVSEDATGTLEIFSATDRANTAEEKARRPEPPRPPCAESA